MGAENITTYMESNLYKAAAERDFNNDAFKNNIEHLDRLLTPNENTLVHIHIAAQCDREKESMNFLKKIQERCPKLLWKTNKKGETPLHLAARYGRHDTVAFLIEQAKAQEQGQELEEGARVPGGAVQMLRMVTCKEKDTTLHEAVRFNHGPVVALLLMEDPELSCYANDAGETPLYLAAESGFCNLVSLILDKCTSPAHGGPLGRTALHAAVIGKYGGIVRNILEKKGSALTKTKDIEGWTPLHYAAHLNCVSLVKQLLDFDLSVAYIPDEHGNTALHFAAANGNDKIMKVFLSRCPDCFELVDEEGRNALHFAIDSRKASAVELVLHNSLLIGLFNEKDNKGNTPLHQLAICNGIPPGIMHHRRVNKMALNKDNLSAVDIDYSHDTLDWIFQKRILKDLEKAGARRSQRKVYRIRKAKESGDIDSIKKIKEAKGTHLIVATLIATVSFAAGFTLPGGYISNKDPEQGYAILTRQTAFKAFVISDAVAFLLSISAVFLHLFLAMPVSKREFFYFYGGAFYLILLAIGAMMVAFMTGLCAVLQQSSGLAISICAISSCFFFLFYRLLRTRYHHKKKEGLVFINIE